MSIHNSSHRLHESLSSWFDFFIDRDRRIDLVEWRHPVGPRIFVILKGLVHSNLVTYDLETVLHERLLIEEGVRYASM